MPQVWYALFALGVSCIFGTNGQGTHLMLTYSLSKTTNVLPGENVNYSLSVQLIYTSASLIRNVRILWYHPSFLALQETFQFPKQDITRKNDHVIFKVREFSKGDVKSIKFRAVFDLENSLSSGMHYCITPVQLLYDDKNGIPQKPQQMKMMQFQGLVPGCDEPLGLNDQNKIKDYQISASSAIPNNRPENVRKDKEGWCANDGDKDVFVQVQFEVKVKITRLEAYGRIDKNHWSNSFSVRFVDPAGNWKYYGTNGFKKVFLGNVNNSLVVSHYLQYPITTEIIRVYPKSWNKRPCIRLEFYGCYLDNKEGKCLTPLGLESGLIPDEALSDSVGYSDGGIIIPSYGRLNRQVKSFPYGWYLPPEKETGYLQIDFGQKMKVVRIAIQGGYSDGKYVDYFVTSFFAMVSNNSFEWLNSGRQNQSELLYGPTDGHAAIYPKFISLRYPLIGRYVRIFPQGYNVLRVMRLEFYGCLAVDMPSESTVMEPMFARRSLLHDGKRLIACQYRKQQTQSSCFTTEDGYLWEEINAGVKNVIAYDNKRRLHFGLDDRLQYLKSQDGAKTWLVITDKQWQRDALNNTLRFRLAIPDYITNNLPRLNQTILTSGNAVWGGSAEGIHMKQNPQDGWKTVAKWLCCGH